MTDIFENINLELSYQGKEWILKKKWEKERAQLTADNFHLDRALEMCIAHNQKLEKEKAQLIEARDVLGAIAEDSHKRIEVLKKEKAALEHKCKELRGVIAEDMRKWVKVRETIEKLPRYNKIWEDMEKSEDGSWVYIDEVLAVLSE